MTAPVCKDCIAEGITRYRPPAPGAAKNRCMTHHRAHKKRTRAATAGKRVEKVYGLTPDQFDQLWRAQGEVCAICRKPVKVRRPAVDHCHVTGIVRGLCCKPCNTVLIGRYSTDDLRRALAYLESPPAFDVIGRVVVPVADTPGVSTAG